jgi:hypothetical protein
MAGGDIFILHPATPSSMISPYGKRPIGGIKLILPAVQSNLSIFLTRQIFSGQADFRSGLIASLGGNPDQTVLTSERPVSASRAK